MELLLTRVAKWCLVVSALVILTAGCCDEDEVPGRTTTEPSAVIVR